MCKDKDNASEQETVERFDALVREELLKAANEYRKEKGLPPLTEKDLDGID